MDLTVKDAALVPKGFVSLRVFRRGRLIDEWCERNLVVNGARQVHALLIGGTFANNNIAQIGFGTGLSAPAAGNTNLTAPFLKALDSVTFPAPGQATFSFSLATAEANGMQIGEFGLFTAAGVLYARKTRAAALAKDSDISLSGSWSIIF